VHLLDCLAMEVGFFRLELDDYHKAAHDEYDVSPFADTRDRKLEENVAESEMLHRPLHDRYLFEPGISL